MVRTCWPHPAPSPSPAFYSTHDPTSVSDAVLEILSVYPEGQAVLLEGFITTVPPRRLKPPQPPACIPRKHGDLIGGKICLLFYGRGKERVILCSILSWYPFPSVSSFPSLSLCFVSFISLFLLVLLFLYFFYHLSPLPRFPVFLFLLYTQSAFFSCSVLNMFLSYCTPCHTCPFWPPLYLAGPLLNHKACLLCWVRFHIFSSGIEVIFFFQPRTAG